MTIGVDEGVPSTNGLSAHPPAPMVARLNGVINAALRKSDTSKTLADLNVQPSGGSTQDFTAQI
jgi:hypothetical protein